MKWLFCTLFVFVSSGLMAQDVIDLSSDSAGVLLKQWEKNTYNPVLLQSTEEKEEAKQLALLNQSLENVYNSNSYRFVGPLSAPPLEALQHYQWKNKNAMLVFNPNGDSLAPIWLVKSYLKKKFNPTKGRYAKDFKETYCVLQTANGEKNVPVNQLGIRRYKKYPREFAFPGSYVLRLGGNPRMVHWRSGILICQ